MRLRAGPPRHFLVIDSDDVDRERIIRLLARIEPGCRSLGAASVEEAIHRLEADGPFDCVLSDYMIGPDRGLDLVPIIAAHRARICPVILVTLRQSEEIIVEAIRSGVADYIPKAALDAERLLNVLHSTLARAEAEERRRESEDRFRRQADALQRHHEDSLRLAATRAEAASEAKSAFLATMSHEIRTPLATVTGLAWLLGQTDLDAQQAELVDKLSVASRMLLDVVNNVLEASRLAAGAVTVERIPFAPRDLGADLRLLAETQIGERPVRFTFRVDPRVPAMVLGDPSRIRQALLNLVSNAIKFTSAGEVSLEIAPASSGSGHLVFAVRDTGIGISPEQLERLFERFFQADASTTRRYGGSGLGLSISRDLVELMGGRIWAESEEGAGSTFHLDVPLEVYTAAPPLASLLRVTEGAHPLAGVRVLLVDDCEINLEIGARILAIEGAEVTQAADPREAVRLAVEAGERSDGGFDFVLMDLQMPEMSGAEAFRRIEGALGARRPPVIALTAAASGIDDETLDCAGMDGIMPKPFAVADLIEVIRRHAVPVTA